MCMVCRVSERRKNGKELLRTVETVLSVRVCGPRPGPFFSARPFLQRFPHNTFTIVIERVAVNINNIED